jgi:hypothetical protein
VPTPAKRLGQSSGSIKINGGNMQPNTCFFGHYSKVVEILEQALIRVGPGFNSVVTL